MGVCEEYPDIIMRSIDGEITPEENARLHTHLTHCSACRELYPFYQQLDRSIRDAEEDPPEYLTGAIMSDIRDERERQRPLRLLKRFRFTAIAAAAALILLVGAKLYLPTASRSAAVTASSAAAEEAAAGAAEIPEANLAAPFDAAEAPAAPVESAAEKTEEPAAAEAEVSQNVALRVYDDDTSVAEASAAHDIQKSKGDTFGLERLNAMERYGYDGIAYLISGIDESQLRELVSPLKPIELDTGETVYEATLQELEDAINQAQLHVIDQYIAHPVPADAPVWIFLEYE